MVALEVALRDDVYATMDDGDATIDDDDATIDDGDASDDANAHTARGTEQYAHRARAAMRTPRHASNLTPHIHLCTFKWST